MRPAFHWFGNIQIDRNTHILIILDLGAYLDLWVDQLGNWVDKGEIFGSTISHFRYV